MFDKSLYEIKEFNYLGINLFKKISGQIKTTCPFCTEDRKNKKDKSLSVNISTGEYNCHHCSKTGNIHKWQKIGAKRTYVKPQWHNKTDLSDKVVKWFEGRKISQKTLNLMKVTEEQEWMPQTEKTMNCIVFNYFYQAELINKKFRDGNKNFKLVKDAEKILYNIDSVFADGVEEMIIAEGEIDALSYIESGINFSLSVPNGASTNTDYLDNYMPLFDHIKKVYIATDNDTKGLILRAELIRRFGIERCYKVDYEDCKDANEYLQKYGTEALRRTISNAKLFPFEGLITISDITDELDDLYENGIGQGYSTGDEYIDKICRLELGKVMVLTGIPSHGKTNFLNHFISKLNIVNGWKTAFYSPESFPIKMHVAKLSEFIIGKRFSGERKMNRDEFHSVLQFMNENYCFIQPEEKNLDNILKTAKYAIKSLGVKVIVIDPWNRLEGMDDDTNSIGREINKVSNFAAEHNVLVIIVAHPTKMTKVKGKEDTDEFNIPTPYDIKGSSCWYDMPDYILVWHRFKAEEYGIIKVVKVREEHLGKPGIIKYRYNINNKRLTATEDNDGVSIPLVWDNTNWLTGDGDKEKGLSDLEWASMKQLKTFDIDNPPF